EGREVLVAAGDRFIHHLFKAGGVHRLLRLVGEALAVSRLVLNDRDLLALVFLGDVLAGDAALRVVAPDGAEDVVPALGRRVVGQRRIGRGRRDLQDAAVIVDGRGRDRGRGAVMPVHEDDLVGD